MSRSGPLLGLRVVDLTGDLGRFATKLLAEMGADVCRPRGHGSRGRSLPGRAGERGGVLDWWFDAATTTVDLDLDRPEGVDGYRELAERADLIVESCPPGYLAERGADHPQLVAANPGLTQVSITPFGRTGPRAGWHGSDLVAAALGGVLSITGTPADPLNSWGWQSYNFGGFCAALCGLAGVRSAREHGRGQLVDLSLHEVVTGSIENLFMQYFYDDLLPLPKLALRQGSLHWLGAYEVVPARTGNIMITPTPQPEQLIDWMVGAGIAEAEPFVGRPVEELLEEMPELMAAVKAFVATDDAGTLFTEGQARHIAFGEVQDVAQVAANPQFAHRELYGAVDLGGGEEVRAPWRLVRFSDTPTSPPPGPAADPTPVDQIVARWAEARSAPPPGPAATAATAAQAGGAPPATAPTDPTGAPTGDSSDRLPRPLDGLVVLDLSWVLAGPFATRLLGDLGADVIKVQTEERATLVNQPEFPYYPVWNRSKRSATLDLKHPEALAVVRRLVERADVLVENYSAGVLDRLGLGWHDVHGWNDQLVYVSMSGCGHDGPWSEIISYAPTVHALCGLTHLTNPAGRGDVGCGFSLNDHAAGFAAALSVLAGVEARRRTGRGQYLDMAQLEVGACLIGPATLEYFATGEQVQPEGNRDGLADPVPNEVYPCGGGGHLAVTATDDEMWARLAPLLALDGPELASVDARRARRAQIDRALADWCLARSAADAMEELQAHGVAAGAVQNAEDLAEHDVQLRDRGFWLEAELDNFGARRHDRFPARWSGTELAPYRPAPSYLGEANFEVWGDLVGLDAEDVAAGIASDLFR